MPDSGLPTGENDPQAPAERLESPSSPPLAVATARAAGRVPCPGASPRSPRPTATTPAPLRRKTPTAPTPPTGGTIAPGPAGNTYLPCPRIPPGSWPLHRRLRLRRVRPEAVLGQHHRAAVVGAHVE